MNPKVIAKSPQLRAQEKRDVHEEGERIKRMHDLIDQYQSTIEGCDNGSIELHFRARSVSLRINASMPSAEY